MINKFLLKEGEKSVLYALIFTVLCALLISDALAWIGGVITLVLLYIYRVPFVSYNAVSDTVSPVDGKVEAIDYVNGKRVLYINVSLCNAHIVRAPLSGSYELITHKKGINLDTTSFKAKRLNENMVIKFKEFTIDFLCGRCNLALNLDSKEEFKQGEKIGVFTHGLVRLTLNESTPSKVKIGQKVLAGITVLA